MPGLTFNVFGHDVSATKAIRGVQKETDSASKHMKETFKEVGKTLAGAFAAEKLIEFGKSSFEAAEKLEKANHQTEAVLKSTGEAAGVTSKDIENLGSSLSKKVGIDHVAIQSAENLLLTFTNVHNEVGKGNDIFTQATKVTTDLSVATGRDLSSATVLVGKALNNPIKGLTALTRIGVSFSAGQIKQIKTMVAHGKTMDAQKIILAELNKKFAGSAEAQVTPAEKAKVAWTSLKEQIGSGLLPVVGKLANFLTNTVIPAISAVVKWIGKNRDWLVPLIAAVVSLVVVLKAWAIAQAILNAVMDTNPLVLIAAAVVALGVALVLAYRKSATFRAIVQAAFAGVKVVAETVWRVLKAIFGALEKAFFAVGDAATTVFGWIKTGIGVVRDVVSSVSSAISTAFRATSNGLKWAWDHIIKPVYGWIKEGIQKVSDVISPIIAAVSDAFKSIGTGLQWAWDHSLGPVFTAIKTAIKEVRDAVGWITGIDLSGVAKKGLDKINAKSGQTAADLVNSGPQTVRHNAQGSGYFGGGATWLNELGRERVTLPRGAQITSASAAASQDRMWNGRAVKQSVVNHNNITVINNNPQQERASMSTPAGLRTAQATFGGGRG